MSASSSSFLAIEHAGQDLAPDIPHAFYGTGCYGVMGPDPSAVLDKF